MSGDTTRTTDGLVYIDGNLGVGGRLDWCEEALLHFTGSLVDGETFDSTYDNDEGPLRFFPGLSGGTLGFHQGIVGMRREGTRRLIIPPQLGFGSEPVVDEEDVVIIPASSTLIYDVELLERTMR